MNYLFFNNKLHKALLFVCCLLFFAACQQNKEQTPNSTTNGKKKIVCTTSMVRNAVQHVVGDRAEVLALMGTGIDPHLYKATQGDLSKLSNADVIFYNGLFLEGKMQDIFEKLALKKHVVAVSDDIDKTTLISAQTDDSANADTKVEVKNTDNADITQPHALYDPHIWFDVSLWTRVVAKISNEMQQIDTLNANFYRQNALAYIDTLEKLHTDTKNAISTIAPEKRVLITSHDAFRYFGKAYNIEVKGLQGISTIAEFGLQDISQMVDFIVKRGIKAVFVESSVSPKALEAVVQGCKQRGHDIKIGCTLFSDSMGADNTPEGNYEGMVRYNVACMVNALK